MSRDADGQHDRSLGAQLTGDLGTSLDRGTLARHDDLARRVPVRDDERATRRGRLQQLGDPRVVETDDRGHRAVATLARRLHELTATADESNAIRERQHAARDERRVLTHRMTRGEGRRWRLETRGRPAIAHRLEDRDRRGEEGGLRVLGAVESLGWAFPGKPAQRLAESRVRRGPHRPGGGR